MPAKKRSTSSTSPTSQTKSRRGDATSQKASATQTKRKRDSTPEGSAPEEEAPKTKQPRRSPRSSKSEAPAAEEPKPIKGKGKATTSLTEHSEIKINRAPILTLWATVVAEREGYSRETALTIGKWIAGHFAQAKGRSLGMYEAADEETKERRREQRREHGVQKMETFGTYVYGLDGKAVETNDKPINPQAVTGYLERAFGNRLGEVEQVMRELAEVGFSSIGKGERSFADRLQLKSIPPSEIGKKAYHLYEKVVHINACNLV